MVSDIILNSPIFRDYILPFILVFAIIFAVLERSNIFGEGKKQVNALIGLVIGLLLISFPASRDIIVKLMPVLAVMVVVLLVFIIIYGFAKQEKEIKLPRGAISVIVLISVVVVAVTLLKITGAWDPFISFIKTENGGRVFSNVVLVVAIATAMVAVWNMHGDKK
jgi:hypothetical protein